MSLIRTLPVARFFFSCARPLRISFALRQASSRCTAWVSRACLLACAGPAAHPMSGSSQAAIAKHAGRDNDFVLRHSATMLESAHWRSG